MPTTTSANVTPAQRELGVSPPPGQKSCASCPSALSSNELQTLTGKGIGAPVCAIKLLPLVRPDQNDRVRSRVLQKIASTCDDYGKDRPEFDGRINFVEAPIALKPVGIGMPTLGPPQPTDPKPRNCVSCVYHVGPTDVAGETGWNGALCTAKGTLLLTDRLMAYAQNCKVGRVKTQADGGADLSKFMFNPEYTKSFGEVDRAALIKKMRSMDPGDWPTEKEVTAADKEYGIKSWRKISDPDGVGADAYLPIFDINFFEGEERELVPRTGDEENPELYRDHDGSLYQLIVLMVEMKMVPAAWGIPGVGKTEVGRHIAWLMQAPFARISITEKSEIDDIFGKMMFNQEKGTYFVEGRIPKRWRRTGVTVLDEPNTGPNEIWQGIRPMTDNSKQLVLDMSDDHRRISKALWSLLYLAMNPAHDARNVGTNVIGDADARRLMHVEMHQPPRDVEMDIIRDHCLAKDGFDPTPHLKKILDIAEEIRPMCDSGALPITWGTAVNIKIARAMKWFDPMKAYQVGALNFLDPRVRPNIVRAIKSVY